jgi:hypothetical protein
MQEGSLWTNLSPSQIADELERLGTPVTSPTVRSLLDELGFAKRKIEKCLAGGSVPDRNQQFERIESMKNDYFSAGNPVFSIDTKKKEMLGNLYRAGRVYCQAPFEAFDHDFPSWSAGKMIPHGIWDMARNHGHLSLGLSHDTSQFACDAFRYYWKRMGASHYPDATSILWFCDAGGSNNCRHNIFKYDLQNLVNELGIEIRVAHYPTYCSKYNPIERRFFPHVTRACAGVLFDSLQTVQNLMRATTTRTGLRTTVHVMKKFYATQRKATRDFLQNMPLKFDDILPRWNYRATPQIGG